MIWQVVCHYEELWAKLGPINFLSCVDEKAGLVRFWRLKEPFEKDSPELPYAELRNVSSFTRSKILELNFTPRKARK